MIRQKISVLWVLLSFPMLGHAQEWPKVPFADWPRVHISQIKAPEPFVDSRPAPGSVTREYRRPVVSSERRCNERRQDGSYVLVRC